MLVVGNGTLITRDEGFPFVKQGAVAIDKTRIAAVGQEKDIREAYRDAEYIDAKGGLIMLTKSMAAEWADLADRTV